MPLHIFSLCPLALQKDISTFSNYLQKEEGKHFHFLMGWNDKINTLTFSNSNRNKFSPPDSKWCGHMAGKTPQLLCPYTPENSSPLNFAPFLVKNIWLITCRALHPFSLSLQLVSRLFQLLPLFDEMCLVLNVTLCWWGQKRKSFNCLQLNIYIHHLGLNLNILCFCCQTESNGELFPLWVWHRAHLWIY